MLLLLWRSIVVNICWRASLEEEGESDGYFMTCNILGMSCTRETNVLARPRPCIGYTLLYLIYTCLVHCPSRCGCSFDELLCYLRHA
jgi:hypothetical protein